MPQDEFLPEGTQLGRYKIKGIIASGGFGTVYGAIDTHYSAIKRDVAIKVLCSPEPDKVASLLQTFNQEVTALSRLNHPHILPIYDYDALKIGNKLHPYIVMPLCEKSLDDWRKEHPHSSPEVVSHLLQQAAESLQHIHAKGIVHKDVKPENFLLLEDGFDIPYLLLADFGIVKLDIDATTSDQMKGSCFYMAPERWNQEGSRFASDQYSLAVMAFKLLTGEWPFQGGNVSELMIQHCHASRPALSKYNSSLMKFDEVIKTALSIEPDKRYPSVTKFAEAFDAAIKSPEKGEDIQMTLVLTEMEALAGTECVLDVEGKKIPITIQSGSSAGKPIIKHGFGKPLAGYPPGDLLVMLAIRPDTKNQDLEKSLKYIAKEIDDAKTSTHSQLNNLTSDIHLVSNEIGGIRSTLSNNLAPSMNSISDRVGNIGSKQRRHMFLNLGLSLLLVALLIAGGLTLFLTSQPALRNIQASLNKITSAKTPTPTSNPDLAAYPPSGSQLNFIDPLNDNSLGNDWNGGPDGHGGSCEFSNAGGYLASEMQVPGFKTCYANGASYNNFTFQVTMTIISGDCGGILFRAEGPNYYAFYVCEYGSFLLRSNEQLLKSGTTSAIKLGSAQPNIVAVVANGSEIDLYVNHIKIDSVTDNTYAQGDIGVIADSNTAQTDALYSSAELWTL